MDELIVLRSSTKRLAKLVRHTSDGIVVDGYDEAAKFTWEARAVDCIEALAMELEQLSKDPNACVIRGTIKAKNKDKKVVNRRQHVGKDGVEGDWDNHTPGRRWVAFDIDKMPLPEHLRPGDVVTRQAARVIAGHARSTLPEEFRGASCAYHFSGSAGLRGWQDVSMHLWFWMDRPVFDLSWRAWADGKGVDASLFKAVQPHYTADPVIEDGEDHLAGVRFGLLDGEPEVVACASLHDFDGWQKAEDLRVAAKRAEIEARRAAIVGAPEQSAGALRKYVVQALAGAVGDIMSAPVGNRHGTLTAKAHKLGGLVQDGALDESEVLAALDEAIVVTFPPNRHASSKRTARDLVAIGMSKPSDLSWVGRKAGKKPDLRLVKSGPDDDDIPMPEPGEATAKKKEPKKKQGGPEWVDLDEKGKVLSTAPNFAALTDWMGYRPRRNLMSHQTDWDGVPPDIALECRQGAMAGIIIDEALRHGWRLTKDNFGMHLGLVEARRAFHPVVDWVRSKPWDGVSRFGQLFDTLTLREGFEHCADLMRTQMEKWLIAGGRCLALDKQSADGVAAQGVLVLQGPQNLGKTRWFKALLPNPAWFSEGLTMDPSNKDHVIQGTATFICELGELDATTRKSDVAQLKAFLTRSIDIYRSPYGQRWETYPRRTIYGATVNPDTFLVDDTGNRRFWVMPVSRVNADHGVDMQQLWAEATARAEAGETCWMPEELQADQLKLAGRFEARSEWADDFFKVFRLPLEGERGEVIRVSDVRQAILPDRNWSPHDMKSFTQFLVKIKAKTSMRNGANHVCLVRW